MEANMHDSSAIDASMLDGTHDLSHVNMDVSIGMGVDGDGNDAHVGTEDEMEGQVEEEVEVEGDGDGDEHGYALDPLDEITTAEIISASIRANVAAQEAEERARAMAGEAGPHAAASAPGSGGGGSGIGVGSGMAYPGHHMLSGAMVGDATQDDKVHMVNLDAQTHTPPGDPSAYSLHPFDPHGHAHGGIDMLSGPSTAMASGSGSGNDIVTAVPDDDHNTDMLALYGRPLRDENTPHPEMIDFNSKTDFELWLEGELAWCHYIQRRITTPQKRAAERAKARDQKYYKAVYDLTPEERADLPMPLRRKRARTSTVAQKITYTCHHAGTYTSKHSDRVPEGKQRLNTKKSVKCGCTSRIVVNEMESGLVHVAYHWRHVGHDPFASDEMESSRLPRVVDEWVVNQIHAGKSPEEIRRMLTVSDEVKAEYVRRETENPDTIDPSMPPSLAWAVKIKYADIYNRYRKLHGTIRSSIQTPGDGSSAGGEHNGVDGAGADGTTPGAVAGAGIGTHDQNLHGGDDDEKASTGATPPPVLAMYNTPAPELPALNPGVLHGIELQGPAGGTGIGVTPSAIGMGMDASLGGAMNGVSMGVDPISFAPVNNGVIDWHLSDDDEDEDEHVDVDNHQHTHDHTAQQVHVPHVSVDIDAIDPIFRPASSPDMSMHIQGEGDRVNLVQPVFALNAGLKRSHPTDGGDGMGQYASDPANKRSGAIGVHQGTRQNDQISTPRAGAAVPATSFPASSAGAQASTSGVGAQNGAVSSVGVGVGIGVGATSHIPHPSTTAQRVTRHDHTTPNAPSAAETLSAINAAVAASSSDTQHTLPQKHNAVSQGGNGADTGNLDPADVDAGDATDAEADADGTDVHDPADAFGLDSYFGDQAAMSELQMLANEIREHWRQ